MGAQGAMGMAGPTFGQQAPQPAQPQGNRFMQAISQNPEVLLALGSGLLGGRTGSEQWSGGLGAMSQAMGTASERRKEEKKKNETMEWLRKQAPEYAQAVEVGALSLSDAYKMKMDAQKPQKPSFINAGEGRLFNENTGEWITAPGGTNKPLSSVGKINADFNAGLIDQATRDALIQKAAQSEGMEIVSDGQGGFTLRQGLGVGGKPGKMTESQAKANIYASRGENANQVLSELEGQGTSLGQSLASGVPVAGNYALTPEYQKYDQAKRDFVNAILRQESGAVIADTEFRNAERQYFPQPGDGPEVIAQKRRNREVALKAIREASGQPAPAQDGVIPAEEYFK